MMEALHVRVDITTNTDQAIESLRRKVYHVLVSDMRRGLVPDEGLKMLTKIRQERIYQPTIFTVGRFDPTIGTPAYAFGITNRVDELLNLIFDVLERVKG